MKAVKASVLSVVLVFAAALATDALAAGRGGHGGGGHRGGHGGHGHGGHHHGSVRIGVGFGGPFWYGGGYWPYYRPYYYGYPVYPAYAPAYPAYSYYPYPAAAQAPAYVEQDPGPSATAPAAGYWYYCNESQAYYPHVQQCAGPWQRVPPQPPS